MSKRVSILLLCVLPLCGCISSRLPYLPYQYGELNEAPFEEEAGDGYSKRSEFATLSCVSGDLPNVPNETLSHAKRANIPSTGEQKLLVIPVDFEEYPGKENQLSHIEQAFFGKDYSDQFPSVASYFEKSSYGRLQLKGGVDKAFFRPSPSYQSLAAKSGAASTKTALEEIYAEAIAWHDATFPEDPSEGYAFTHPITGVKTVPVYFVYTAPFATSSNGADRSSMFWAFTINSPAPISWSSYAMLYPSGNSVDSHTCIHETGHLFGLEDYYDTFQSGSFSRISPLGRADMMDCSLGDENPFSKMFLNWIQPTFVTGSCELTLHQFAGNGEAVVVKANPNGTPFDEYLLIDFYSPTGLNRLDAKSRRDDAMRMINKSGVRIYHVDARLGVFFSGFVNPTAYFSPATDLSGGYVLGLHNDNSGGQARDGRFSNDSYLIQLMDASSDSATFPEYFVASDKSASSGAVARRDVLFQKGDEFSKKTYKDFSFHDGSAFTFSIHIDEVAADYAKVRFDFGESA